MARIKQGRLESNFLILRNRGEGAWLRRAAQHPNAANVGIAAGRFGWDEGANVDDDPDNDLELEFLSEYGKVVWGYSAKAGHLFDGTTVTYCSLRDEEYPEDIPVPTVSTPPGTEPPETEADSENSRGGPTSRVPVEKGE